MEVGGGVRATEENLLREVSTLVEAGREDPALLEQPIRVLVPSGALRKHVSSRLVARFGRSVLGLRVQTLYGFALEIIEGAGEAVRPAGLAERVFVERAAREAPSLGPLLSELSEGCRATLRPVRDLLDSGLTGTTLPYEEAAAPAPESIEQRSREVLAMARRTRESVDAAGLDLPGKVLVRATRILQQQGASPAPSRSLVVHGFGDATGVAVGLLREALRVFGGLFLVDLPPAVGRETAGRVEPGRALETAVGVLGAVGDLPPLDDAPPLQIESIAARGPRGEAREVARRIRDRLDSGLCSEEIGVVARSLTEYIHPLRHEFNRLGIPFSGVRGSGPALARARWGALPALMRDPGRFPADDWLELQRTIAGEPLPCSRRALLRLGLRSLGAARLHSVAGLRLEEQLGSRKALRLPLVLGIEALGDGPGGRGARKWLARSELEAVVGRAAAVLELCARLPEMGPFRAFVDEAVRVVQLLDEDGDSEVSDLLQGLRDVPWSEEDFERAEFLSVLEEALAGLGRTPLGGRGGGVAVLALREVRGRTFSELFVLGTNRGNFPKVGGDDPLLPESVRRELRGNLPFLPCAASEPGQERHLFAQLLSMSPRVTLSWQKVDASGRPAAPSPLLALVGTDGRGGGVLVPSDARPAIARELPRPSPPEDHLARVAIYEPRSAFAALLPGVVEQGRGSSGVEELLGDATAVAASRAAVLGEFDPDLGESAGQERWRQAGPFLGLVGPIRGATDPRARPLSASSLEGLSYCPWQTLLGRYLALSELPDPLAAVPHADRRMVGILVHRVLELLVLDGGIQPGGSLEEVLARPSGFRLRPPSADRLAELTLQEARTLLEGEGLRLPGLDEILQRRALTFLDRAFEDGSLPPVLDEDGEGDEMREILGVEVDGVAELGGRRVTFRADRVDRVGEEVVFVDYKTGGSISAAVRPATREKAYLSGVASGRRLQAAVYAASQGPSRARGRFLFLRPDLEPVARRVEQSSEDEGARELASSSVSVLAEGLEAGVLFPRLVEPTGEQEPAPCKTCVFASACLRGDSGARGRLARIARALESGEAPDAAGPATAAFAALWKLPSTPPDGGVE